MDGQVAKRRTRRRWYNPVAIGSSLFLRPKVFAAAVVGGAVLLALGPETDWPIRLCVAWVAGGATYLALALRVMWQYGTHDIRQRAAAQDDSAVVILCLILAAIAASFIAIAGVLSKAGTAGGSLEHPWLLALAAATIVTSWSVTQVAFALHYAHEFYAPSERQKDAESGLEFPHDDEPDYWDFVYFSTAIGATSQTSDTGIKSKSMRRLVTLHAIISFFFNTMVLALTINLASSLVQGLG